MHWNEREGNQKEKIKNETRWGQILYLGRKGFSSDALQKEETVYMYPCIHISMEEKFIFLYDFFKLFVSFPSAVLI